MAHEGHAANIKDVLQTKKQTTNSWVKDKFATPALFTATQLAEL